MRSYLRAKAGGNPCWAYDPKACLAEFVEQNCPNMVLEGSGFGRRSVFEAWVMAHPNIDGESMRLLVDHGADVFTSDIAFRVMFCHDPAPLACLLDAGLNLDTTKLGTSWNLFHQACSRYPDKSRASQDSPILALLIDRAVRQDRLDLLTKAGQRGGQNWTPQQLALISGHENEPDWPVLRQLIWHVPAEPRVLALTRSAALA
ncbi:hypothetical protein [Luteimonas sp. SDU101]|uniref:hypothetical protein n=1 Tax=Luteimonas sp. SDU101 TaxID=3422593 RepID=UPI003EB83B79